MEARPRVESMIIIAFVVSPCVPIYASSIYLVHFYDEFRLFRQVDRNQSPSNFDVKNYRVAKRFVGKICFKISRGHAAVIRLKIRKKKISLIRVV